MMIPQSLRIFPDTRPKDEVLFPLVQLFAEAVYIAPVENELPKLPPLASKLLAEGLLRFHCPAPLGEERARFLSLLKELRQRPADYAALSLSALTAPGPEENGPSLLATLRQRGKHEERTERLWRARLVLKLAEIMAQEEEKIRHNLRRIALREKGLFNALRDEQAAASAAVPDSPAADSRRTRLRLKAWRDMLALDGGLPADSVSITTDQDAFELLLEEHDGQARAVLSLPLPAVLADSDFAEKRAAFREAAALLLQNLPDSFEGSTWAVLLEQHYPAERHGRCRLALHFLPNFALGLLEL